MNYKVIPFTASVASGDKNSYTHASKQLETLIQNEAKDGWEYVSLDRIETQIKAGCLSLFGGGGNQVTSFQVVIFRRS